ncbi:bifunctional 2',3'-cyclic nucleotide 2'-phosphodiesterase/3'-nucleotidase precursor protein [Serratia plymuthica]|uniref:Bifunctional 2',3'-cyclic nucleotide 2'-phosphodiesterase/3'-nucleotidase protein n=1 Tax=Serratia plymuthica TaxID=82996 RepID=A0A2X4UEI7_SERPL|nr:bifunctional 2',3'-cyclic nucleotide 2'-phosphodiesterase/3'-nucleotidase precursor protein [Serratia plymuthica]
MHVKIDKAVVNGVIITEPDKYGRALSRIDLQFERRDGKFALINKDSFTYPIKGITPDSGMLALYQPYHDILRANANRVVATLTGSDLVPADEIKGIPQVHIQDTGISALFQQAARYYAPQAQVIALQIDNDSAKLDVGEIKAKDIAFNYQYAGGEITVYQLNGKALKQYMEWSAGYFNQLKPVMLPTALTRRVAPPNTPPTTFSTASPTASICANPPVRALPIYTWPMAPRLPTRCRFAWA